MRDVDTLVLASDPDHLTVLAAALEIEMMTNAAAREAYARIYGREWVGLDGERFAAGSDHAIATSTDPNARTCNA